MIPVPLHCPPAQALIVEAAVSHAPTWCETRWFLSRHSPGDLACFRVGPEYAGLPGWNCCESCRTSSWWCGSLNYRCPDGWYGNGPWVGFCAACEADGRGESWERIGTVLRAAR